MSTQSEPSDPKTNPVEALDGNWLANFGDPSTAQVEVLTRFMETIEPVEPVSAGTSFHPFLNEAGWIDLYSVGTGGELFRLRRQQDGQAAYAVEELGVTVRMPAAFSGPTGLDDPDIFGVDLEGRLTLSRWNPLENEYQQRVEQPQDAQQKIGEFHGAKVGNTLHANVLLEDGTVASNFLRDGGWASRRWVPVLQPDGKANARALSIAMCHNNPVQNELYAISDDRSVWFADSRNAFTRFQDLGFLRVDHISVLQDGERRLNIFAIGRRASRPDDPTSVWVKRQRRHSSVPGRIEWEDWQKIATGVRFRELRSTVESNGSVSVFGIEDGDLSRLFVLREQRDDRGRRVGWGHLVPLGNPVPGALFEIAQNADGLAEAYSVVEGGAIAGDLAAQSLETVMYRFWQDPQTTQWFSEPVRIEESTEAVSLPTYAVEIRVRNHQGAPVPFAELKLSSSVLATFRVNGRNFPVSRLHPLKVQTDASGNAVVYYITGSLTAPTLGVQLEGVRSDEGLTIEPNAQLIDHLYALEPEEVLDAKRADGQPLLRGTEPERRQNAEAIAKISQRAMSLGRPDPLRRSWVDPPFLASNPSQTGLHHRHHFSARNPFLLRAEDVPEQHWRVQFVDRGGVRYEELDRAAAKVHCDALVASSVSDGLLGLTWGDIWQSIRSGVGAIYEGLREFVVSTIIDPIGRVRAVKVFFHLVIRGVTYVIDETIRFVQQAFDIIEGIWNKVRVAFQDLYEWLAFVFDLGDIRRTAAVVRHSINVSIDFAGIALDNIKQTVIDGIGNVERQVQESVNQLIEHLEPGESFGHLTDRSQHPAARAEFHKTDGHNVVLNAFMANYSEVRGSDNDLLGLAQDSKIQRLVEQLEAMARDLEFGPGKEAFDQGVAYFSRIGSDPGNAINFVFAGTVRIVESLALAGLAIARGFLTTILNLLGALLKTVKTAINSRLEVPVLSQIYRFFTGRGLSFSGIDAAALMIAVPATVAEKIVRGKALFPNDEAADRFRRTLTAERLAQLAGFKVQGRPVAKVSRRAVAALSSVRENFGKLLMWSFAPRVVTEPTVNWLIGADQVGEWAPGGRLGGLLQWFGGLGNWAKGTLSLLNVLFRAAASAFSFPWLPKEDDRPGSGLADWGEGFGKVVWCLQAFFGPLFGLIFWFFSVGSTVNLARLFIWGVVHLVCRVIQWSTGGFKNWQRVARALSSAALLQASWFFTLRGQSIMNSMGNTLIWQSILSSATALSGAILSWGDPDAAGSDEPAPNWEPSSSGFALATA